MLEIHVEQSHDHTICRPVGELDLSSAGQFREALDGVVHEARIVFDLSGVPFMDSAGLGALIGGIRRTRENNGAVAVTCNRPALCQLLRTTGFDRIVTVTETLEAALESFDSPPLIA